MNKRPRTGKDVFRYPAKSSANNLSHLTANIAVFSIVLILSGCAQNGVSKSVSTAGATSCPDPRPVVCTLDYRPVCGTRTDGSMMAYPNGCGACADSEVVSWVEGACPE